MIEIHPQPLCEQINIDAIQHFIPLDAARQWGLHYV